MLIRPSRKEGYRVWETVDTIDHLMLISRLSSWYGISGKALDWFTCMYLSDRCHQMKIQEYISDAVYMSFGVPQGSVLGPILSGGSSIGRTRRTPPPPRYC